MKRLLMAAGLVVVTANAFATWQAADGYFDDPASWSQGYVPSNTSQNAQWWYERDVNAIVRLRDRVGCFNLFKMNLFYGYDQTVTFDGAGADFSMGAIPSGAGQRSEYYPFAIQNGNGYDYNAFFVHTGGSYTKSVFRWTNVLTRVRHVKGASVNDSETHLSFERGMSCFAGVDGTDTQTKIYVGSCAYAGRQVELVVTNDAEVVVPNLLMGGKSGRTLLTVAGETSSLKAYDVSVGLSGSCFFEISGGTVTVPQYVKLGTETATVAVTNIYRQTGGYAAVDGWISVSNPSDALRTARVELDGGVLKTTRIMGGGSVADPSGVVSEFSADGGTLRARTNVDLSNAYPFLYGFRKAELGAKGLTVDPNGFNVHIPQCLTSKAGQNGRLIVAGSGGTVYLSANGCEMTELVCAGGTTRLESSVTDWDTTAVVTNGATLSLTQVAGLALDGLVLGNAKSQGVIQVAPSTRLSLDSVEFNRVTLALSGTFAANTDYPLVSVAGSVNRLSVAAWKALSVSGSVPSGCTAQPFVSYDAGTDRSTLTLRFEAGVTPVDENVWQGATGAQPADWNDAKNWSKGVPSAASVVTLSGDSSAVAATLRVSSLNATLGALAFSAARDYLIDGNGLLYFGSTAEATITVVSGNQEIDVPIVTKAGLSASVATGASLTLGGRLTVGGERFIVNPTHTRGHVYLEGEGSSARTGIRLAGGILELASSAVVDGFADGTTCEMWDTAIFRVNGEPSDPTYRLPFGFVLMAGSSYGSSWGSAEMICNDCPLVVPPYIMSLGEGGNLVKMGAAPLVFETGENKTLLLAQCNGRAGTTDWNSLPQNVFRYNEGTGVAEWTTSYGGVNVLEGELVFKGTADIQPVSGSQAVANGHGLFVGLRTTNTVSVTPGLVFDRVYADVGYAKTTVVAVAENAYQSQWPAAMDNAYLVVSNGSTLAAGRLRVGGFAFATADINKRPISPRVSVDGSELKMLEYTHFSSEPHVSAVWRVGGQGVVKTGSEPAVWNGSADVRFEDGSVLEAGDADSGVTLALGAKAKGTMTFASEAVAKIAGFEAASGSVVTLAFDGGRLQLENGTTISMPTDCTLRADAGGLIMDIPEGETWTLASDVSGDGVVKVVGQGTLALSGSILASFAGTGTVSGGTLTARAKLCPSVSDAGIVSETVCLDGVSFAGRVMVDLGHDKEHPLSRDSLVGQCVARYTGATPDVSQLRITGVDGSKAYARFVAANGEIKIAEISDSIGLMIMIR